MELRRGIVNSRLDRGPTLPELSPWLANKLSIENGKVDHQVEFSISSGGFPVRLPVFRALLVVGILCTGISSIADETRRNGPCSGFDSRHDCVFLGELSDVALLVGIFESCTDSRFSISPGSKVDPDSSVIYQFDLKHLGVVKLDVVGLWNASILKEDAVVVGADKYMTSISHRFEPGRYTLIGHAPLCENGKVDLNRGYRIRIDPHGAEDSTPGGTVDRTGEVVVLTREERKSIWDRVGMLTLVTCMTLLAFGLLLLLWSGEG